MKRIQLIAFLALPPTIVVIITYCTVNIPLNFPLDGEIANNFLSTIAGVLAGILAIVFSISVLAVEIYSDRYTPRAFSYIQGNWIARIAFVTSLICILIAVVSLGIQTIPMYHVEFLLMSGLFVFCLMVMAVFSINTLSLLNPGNLADKIYEDAIKFAKKSDPKSFREIIVLLGDISLKAFERGEDQVSIEYLNGLQKLQIVITKDLVLKYFHGWEHEVALFDKGCISPIVEQLNRVYKKAVNAKDEEITRHISGLLSEIIESLIIQELEFHYQKLNNQILNIQEPVTENEIIQKIKGILVYQYPELVKTAIDCKDDSRYLLLLHLRNFLFSSYLIDIPNDDCLSYCCNALYEINNKIIDCNDFSLWKAELGYFSNTSIRGDYSGNDSLEQQYRSFHTDFTNFLYKFLDARISFDTRKLDFWQNAGFLINSRITRNNKEILELVISDIKSFIPASNLELQTQATLIQRALSKLWVTTAIYDTFYRTCVYALYKKNYPCIKELWQHVNPPDVNAHYSNVNMVYFNIEFLTHQMINLSVIPWELEDYHGAEAYVHQFFLLCLAFTLQQYKDNNKDYFNFALSRHNTTILNVDQRYLEVIQKELKSNYYFLVNLPYRLDKAVTQYDAVNDLAENWNDIFRNQASESLLRARDWLLDTKNREEWSREITSFMLNLPVEQSLVEAYQRYSTEYYRKHNIVNELAMAENTQPRNPIELKTSCSVICPEKINFTIIGYGEREISSRVGFESIEMLFKAEINYVLKTLLSQESIKRIRMIRLSYQKLVELIIKMYNSGYDPTTILLSHQHITNACENDLNFRANIVYEEEKRYLKINQIIKLQIFETQDENHVYILNKKAGYWNCIDPLDVDARECEKRALSVRIVAKEVVEYQVVVPEIVAIINSKALSRKNNISRME